MVKRMQKSNGRAPRMTFCLWSPVIAGLETRTALNCDGHVGMCARTYVGALVTNNGGSSKGINDIFMVPVVGVEMRMGDNLSI